VLSLPEARADGDDAIQQRDVDSYPTPALDAAVDLAEATATDPRATPSDGGTDAQPDLAVEDDAPSSGPDMATLVADFLRANPSRRVEDIARALGLVTAEVSPVVKDLVDEKVLRRRGDGRWATYSAR
jgi:hypothetical protein